MKKVDREMGTNHSFVTQKIIEHWLTYKHFIKLCILSVIIVTLLSYTLKGVITNQFTRIDGTLNTTTHTSSSRVSGVPFLVMSELNIESYVEELTYDKYLRGWDILIKNKHERCLRDKGQCKSYIISEDGDNGMVDSTSNTVVDHHKNRHKYEMTSTGTVIVSDAAIKKRAVYQKYVKDPSFQHWKSYLNRIVPETTQLHGLDYRYPLRDKEIELGYFESYTYEGEMGKRVINLKMVYDIMDFACPYQCNASPCMSISAVQLGIDKNILLLNKDNEDDPNCLSDLIDESPVSILKRGGGGETTTCPQERVFMIDPVVIFEDKSTMIEVLYDDSIPAVLRGAVVNEKEQQQLNWVAIPEMIVVEFKTIDGKVHKSKFHGKNAACILECIKINTDHRGGGGAAVQ